MIQMEDGWMEPKVTALSVTPGSPIQSSEYNKTACCDWTSRGFEKGLRFA